MKKITILSLVLIAIIFISGCSKKEENKTQSEIQNPKVETPIDPKMEPIKPETEPKNINPGITQPQSTELDESSIVKNYINNEHGFTFLYPKEWKMELKNPESKWGQKTYIVFDSGFSISVSDTSKYSFDELRATPPEGINPESVREKDTTLDRVSAKETAYTAVGDTNSGGTQMKIIAVQKNNLTYIIECKAIDCERVTQSFKFTK